MNPSQLGAVAKGAVAKNQREDYAHVYISGFDGLSIESFINLPETATLQEIKAFQETLQQIILEARDAAFCTSTNTNKA